MQPSRSPTPCATPPLPTQQRVVATTLAPGVVLMGGGSHNSIAVEFKDFVTVIDGPLSNQRTNAVVAEVKKTFPNKPIRYLVNTHNHFDHLGGARLCGGRRDRHHRRPEPQLLSAGRLCAAAAVASDGPAVDQAVRADGSR